MSDSTVENVNKEVIGFHYSLKDKEDNLIDSSTGKSPLLFLVGSGQIIPGLEKELIQMNIGDKKLVEVKAADAYGEVLKDLQVTVKKNQFPEGQVVNIGDKFQVTNEQNAPIFTVVGLENDDVHIDGNHPMAGKDLYFDVEITDKRQATKDEIAHGHAHGEGGHQH